MKIAVTGGVAEGKSTVLQMLADEGYRVSSSDEVARELFVRPEVNRRLAAIAGRSEAIAPAELRQAIEESDDVRRAVNRYLHPLISSHERNDDTLFVEVPLLIEACLQGNYGRVWVVTCGEAEQVRRLTERLGDAKAARRLIASQLPTRCKSFFADVILRTNENFETVRSMLREAVAQEML